MELEEAIIHAEVVADKCAVTDGNIKCEMEHRQLAEWLKELKERREKELQQSCNQLATDTINRQAAVDVLMEILDRPNHADFLYTDEICRALEWLPSAQPDGIPLEWIDKHLEWLDNCDNDFAQLAKVGIRAMVDLWKKDRT